MPSRHAQSVGHRLYRSDDLKTGLPADIGEHDAVVPGQASRSTQRFCHGFFCRETRCKRGSTAPTAITVMDFSIRQNAIEEGWLTFDKSLKTRDIDDINTNSDNHADSLFDGDRLSEIARLIYVVAFECCHFTGENLQGHSRNDWLQQSRARGHADNVMCEWHN